MNKDPIQEAVARAIDLDPWLADYEDDLILRQKNYLTKKKEIQNTVSSLSEFANGHHYYGFHRVEDGWVYREWAPAAAHLFLVGDFNDWQPYTHPLRAMGNGDWEICLKGKDALKHGQRIKVLLQYQNQDHYKIPLYIKRVIQEVREDGSIDWLGQIWDPEEDYEWKTPHFKLSRHVPPFIYEAHIGIAQEEGKVSSFREFADLTLPRIKKSGYNVIQLMAIMQHPYYGSFGYHVSNFFAVSSWFGTPEDLKYLIDKAHSMGMGVLMDLVHSHAVKNQAEGLAFFDGSQEQFFVPGPRGFHETWDSMCFNYGKMDVIHFLLSNLKFWMEEYHFDGFRFDGITSMLYWDHGMGTAFTDYSKYFSLNTNTDAVTYLTLASDLIHTLSSNALLVAEDMSGMPGLCLPIDRCGIGFDYRLSMGVPDLWIKNMKKDDHDWSVNDIYYEVTTHRPMEKRINYAESHDQALVGDKTLFFWLTDQEAYWHMSKDDDNYIIDRAIALHKMIRFITLTTGADGYLNFIGNEFGHPEWIDFPRLENGWSYHYARRQWHLADDDLLKYSYLLEFDRAMIRFAKKTGIMGPKNVQLLWMDEHRKIVAYRNNAYIFLFNFHPTDSVENFVLPIYQEGGYRVVFSSDRKEFGGFGRIDEDYIYQTKTMEMADFDQGIQIYSPARTVLVLKKVANSEGDEVDAEARDAIDQMVAAEAKAQQALVIQQMKKSMDRG